MGAYFDTKKWTQQVFILQIDSESMDFSFIHAIVPFKHNELSTYPQHHPTLLNVLQLNTPLGVHCKGWNLPLDPIFLPPCAQRQIIWSSSWTRPLPPLTLVTSTPAALHPPFLTLTPPTPAALPPPPLDPKANYFGIVPEPTDKKAEDTEEKHKPPSDSEQHLDMQAPCLP